MEGKMKKTKGKFIALYGINNLGKTTQAEMLVDRINKNGLKAKYLKYPIYDLNPSGPLINEYLRKNNPYNLSPREAQIFYIKNRYHFEPTLLEMLNNGINIISEDYRGTGIAWGMAAGVDEKFLKNLNADLYNEDLCFLFDGKRFLESTETGHKHENDDTLMNASRNAHLKLATEYGWEKINANLAIEEIHEVLWGHVSKIISTQSGSILNHWTAFVPWM